ncbi:amidohydrolase family protein [Kitasatospora sp. NPDC056076]|uniref:amidohydrolase family protein n=1 Tax=Kitasatospora sp. NPDC056076 TaxID=3345703 RepID=UPI0035DE7D59
MTAPVPAPRTALHRVRVFDGYRLSEPRTVVLEGPVIGTDPAGAQGMDAHGAVLLPGLIDAHIHLDGAGNLEQLRSAGVTTAMDMATWQPQLVERLRALSGVSDFRSAMIPVVGDIDPEAVPGVPEDLVRAAIVATPAGAEEGVRWRVAEGSDYIKIMLGPSGPGSRSDRASAGAVVAAAHARDRRVVAHALTVDLPHGRRCRGRRPRPRPARPRVGLAGPGPDRRGRDGCACRR